jgi:beta-lactamase class A
MASLVIAALLMADFAAPPLSPQPLQQVASQAGQFNGEIGRYATNLTSGEEIAVNADTRFPTASTIKTAVMLEAYHQASEGKLRVDDTVALTETVKAGGSDVLHGLRALVAHGLEQTKIFRPTFRDGRADVHA